MHAGPIFIDKAAFMSWKIHFSLSVWFVKIAACELPPNTLCNPRYLCCTSATSGLRGCYVAFKNAAGLPINMNVSSLKLSTLLRDFSPPVPFVASIILELTKFTGTNYTLL